jgi:hypothetical protein
MVERRVDSGPLRCLCCGYVFPEPVFEPRWDDVLVPRVCRRTSELQGGRGRWLRLNLS